MGGASTSTASPGIAGVHSHTGMAGRDAAGTQSCMGCSDIAGVHSSTACAGIAGVGRVGAASVIRCISIAGVHSYTDMAGRDAAGRHSATDTAGTGVHAVIVCIGIEGAYTGLARVAAGCVAACWVCTDCTGIARVTAGCVAACRVCIDCTGTDKAGTVLVDATGMQSVAYTGATGMKA